MPRTTDAPETWVLWHTEAGQPVLYAGERVVAYTETDEQAEALLAMAAERAALRAELAEARPVVAAARALDAAWLDEREHEAEHRALTAAIDAIDWIAFRLGPQDAALAARDGAGEAAAPPR